jgi:hypothetical protein
MRVKGNQLVSKKESCLKAVLQTSKTPATSFILPYVPELEQGWEQELVPE